MALALTLRDGGFRVSEAAALAWGDVERWPDGSGRIITLIADKTHEVVVIDVKTGRVSPAHRAQVMIYQYAVPKVLEQYRVMRVRGHVRYPTSNVGTPESAVDREFVGNLGALVRRLAAETPARRVPSAAECRFCDITAADCPARIDVGYVAEGNTEDFWME